MSKWKQTADETDNSRVYRIAYLGYQIFCCVICERRHDRVPKDDKYKSKRKGRINRKYS